MVIFLLIFFILFILYGIVINYYRMSWNAIPEYNTDIKGSARISVVIAVRNEEDHVDALLSALSAQDYDKKNFEIIFVDDHSTDRTVEKIKSFETDMDIRLIGLPESMGSKKKAITEGVNAATGQLIVTTDADCTMEISWLSTYASFYAHTNAKFIAAPVLMHTSRSLLSIFQSLDFLTMQGITGASVSKRFHTMCNGANLGYTKKVFEEVKGFAGIDNIPSGDDMLLMFKVFKLYPADIYYIKSKKALVSTLPERTWHSFFQQRIRWASKAAHYQDKRIFYVLLLTYFINVGFLVLAIASFTWINWFMFLLLFLLAKVIIEFPFVNAVAIYFNLQRQMVWFPLLQPLHILYVIISGWLGRFGSYVWKSRKIKTSSPEAVKQ